jgi:hypothetical protein
MELKTLLETPPWEWPPDAGRTFHKVLVDKRADAEDRLIAAELAGDLVVMNEELAADLAAIVGSVDEADDLRAGAAISFGPAFEQADTFGFDDPMDEDEVPFGEDTFHSIQGLLEKVYRDSGTPKLVRRRVLEGSVRAPADWHREAITTAFATGDRDWILTAVFAARYVKGFDKQILEALESKDEDIHYEAVQAAGQWELDAAGPHIIELVHDRHTPKPLRLAAIGAIGSIRPAEADEILGDLLDSEDEEIAEAADEAIAMAHGALDMEDEAEEDEGGSWVN